MAIFLFSAHDAFAQAKPGVCAVKILTMQPPLNLDPRQSLDANSQRLNELLYRGLTRFQTETTPQADLARTWRSSLDKKTWTFDLDSTPSQDHAGEAITPERLLTCMENYRAGKPTSLVARAISGWESTTLVRGVREGNPSSLVFRFQTPRPFFPSDASLLLYFRAQDKNLPPCAFAPGARIGSGDYRLGPEIPGGVRWDQEVHLEPFPSAHAEDSRPALHIRFVTDPNLAVFLMLRREADALYNALSPEKLDWLKEKLKSQYDLVTQDGTAVQYLGFNLEDPLLARLEVRKAIAHSINRDLITQTKLKGFARPIDTLLAMGIDESAEGRLVAYAHDPAQAERLLDDAGFKRGREGIRFTLRYRTTSVKEGHDLALIVQDQLRRVGIDVKIDQVEPAAFLPAIRRGNFQLFSSRWVGVKDFSILERTLRSGAPDNRTRYKSREMDRLLDENATLPIQKKVLADLPYLPLWVWNHTLLVRKTLKTVNPKDIPLSGSYRSFTSLRWKEPASCHSSNES